VRSISFTSSEMLQLSHAQWERCCELRLANIRISLTLKKRTLRGVELSPRLFWLLPTVWLMPSGCWTEVNRLGAWSVQSDCLPSAHPHPRRIVRYLGHGMTFDGRLASGALANATRRAASNSS
jgi:hypothetical protein